MHAAAYSEPSHTMLMSLIRMMSFRDANMMANHYADDATLEDRRYTPVITSLPPRQHRRPP